MYKKNINSTVIGKLKPNIYLYLIQTTSKTTRKGQNQLLIYLEQKSRFKTQLSNLL